MRERQGVMLCYPFCERRLARWGVRELLAQPKIDGVRCKAVVTPENVTLYSSTGLEITSVNHVSKALRELTQETPAITFDGELYSPDLTFGEITGAIATTYSTANQKKIQYHIFDIINSQPQFDRTQELENNLRHLLDPQMPWAWSAIKPVRSVWLSARIKDIEDQLTKYYEAGWEGIILRHPKALYQMKRCVTIMKIKPTQEDLYRVVGWEQEIDIHGTPKEALGALICVGSAGDTFSVGSGFTRRQRLEYWQNKESLIGNMLRVKYQSLTIHDRPRFPVFKEVV